MNRREKKGNTKGKINSRFTTGMQKKLAVLFILVLSAFIGLTVRLVIINKEDGEKYKKKVLSQQQYDSMTIPFRRGDILDSKGTKLAVSEKVYNVILDASVMLSKDGNYEEPTIAAAESEMGLDGSEIRSVLAANPDSAYYVLAKQMTYDQISSFRELQNDPENGKNIRGIWFEEEYKRKYPNNTLACDVIGFTTSDNSGLYGLEQHYNDVLSGTPGREYGYLNNDSTLERSTISAVDGNSIVSTIDANIQSIVEKHLKKFNDDNKNGYTERNGSNNTACIIMDVNSGEVISMAGYPVFDLNNPKDKDTLIGMPMVNDVGNRTGEYITAENYAAMEPDLQSQQFNSLWRNFCINDTYEPGSVAKPFTVAAALDSASITGNESYTCNGFLHVGGFDIDCHNIYGDGPLTVAEGVERSCNVVMMNINMANGINTFLDYQHIFNFGLKTNIDLAGESRTASLVYNKDTMGPTDLATNSFGQGYNVSMIQMITAFCSLINGGNYYEPHVVSKVISPSGATVENIEPRLLKQTISTSVSDKIKEYCNLVVSGENGTGKTARPAGYMIGGKTGTAETLPRGNNEYVVSFMGYAPADEPQIAIYVVVDRPNVQYQDTARFATIIVRNILTEVLPYLGIPMTEELTDEERAELAALQLESMAPSAAEDNTGEAEGGTPGSSSADGTGGTADTGNPAGTENPDGMEDSAGTENPGGTEDPAGETEESGTEQTGGGSALEGEDDTRNEVWKDFPIDPETGYAKDPNTGALVDPETGNAVSGSSSTPAGLGSANGNQSDTVGIMDEDNPF